MAAAPVRGRRGQPRGRPRRPPQGDDAQGPLARPRREVAARLALRHRRPGDRPPLEEQEQDLVARREMGRRRQRAAGQVPRRLRRPDPRAARAVHAEHDLPRLPGRPAQPPRAGRQGRRQDAWSSWAHCRSARSPGSSTPWRTMPAARTADESPTPLDPVSRTIAEELLKEIRGAADVPDRRRPALPDARPRGADALRRRGAADPPGQPGRRGAGGRAVHPRRAVDRPASARQRPAARHPASGSRDVGNTVVVVEHDEDTMRAADHLVDFGPGPGVKGGEVVAAGDDRRPGRGRRRA